MPLKQGRHSTFFCRPGPLLLELQCGFVLAKIEVGCLDHFLPLTLFFINCVELEKNAVRSIFEQAA